MSSSDFIIDISGTQTLDDDRDVIRLTTLGNYTVAPTGNRFIRYKEYNNENPLEFQSTTIKVSDERISITRDGNIQGQLLLELNKRHQCHYPTPVGSVMVGIYTRKMDIDLDKSGGKISVEYTLDFDTSVVSENTFDINIRKN